MRTETLIPAVALAVLPLCALFFLIRRRFLLKSLGSRTVAFPHRMQFQFIGILVCAPSLIALNFIRELGIEAAFTLSATGVFGFCIALADVFLIRVGGVYENGIIWNTATILYSDVESFAQLDPFCIELYEVGFVKRLFFSSRRKTKNRDSRKSALVYLIATHVGTLALFGFFCLWKHATGSFDLVPAASGSIPAITANILICLGLFGFGLKAGSMPLHFWLPGAHANAPSHVSALLSAVMLKMGIYGIVRLFMLLPGFSPFWAWFILVLGLFSGLLGVVLAIAQHDIKRLLAYHSVENIGIILMGLGMALLGRIYHREEWVVLGMAGCLLHVWNHAIFKSLLFFGAGSVLHATGTRQLDRLGGLARKMPFTAASFLLGAAAICGLPPLNGFISEFFIYVGFFSSAVSAKSLSSIALLGAPVLAMIGALAVSCFVKAYGAVFLGSPRSACAARSRESSLSMLIPMGVLSLLCVVIGLCPFLTIPVLEKSIGVWLAAPPTMTLSELIPFPALGIVLPVAVVLIALSIVFVIVRARSRAKKTVTWDCGYAKSGARIQYTASSFARSLVDIFSWFLKPRNHLPRLEENFPVAETLDSHVEDPVLDRHLIPDFNFFAEREPLV